MKFLLFVLFVGGVLAQRNTAQRTVVDAARMAHDPAYCVAQGGSYNELGANSYCQGPNGSTYRRKDYPAPQGQSSGASASSSGALRMNPRPPGFSVLNFLQSQNLEIPPAALNDKFTKILSSPFIFYRGTNQLYFRDFSDNPALRVFGSDQTDVWTQSDMHIENFGAFGNNDEDIVYETNDFDESVVQSYQHDLWKLATSLVLVARELRLGEAAATRLVQVLADNYKSALDDLSDKNEDAPSKVQFNAKSTNGILKKFLEKVKEKRSRKKMLNSWTLQGPGGRRFNMTNPDVAALDDATKAAIAAAIPFYKRTLSSSLGKAGGDYFRIKDIVRRLNAGTGSTGKNRYYVLVEGSSSSDDDDIILDVKQSGRPVPFAFFSRNRGLQYNAWFPSKKSEGERHQSAYKALSTDTDKHLGYMLLPLLIPELSINEREFVFTVRERNPWKTTWEYLEEGNKNTLEEMSQWWGRILATQHARSGKQFRQGAFVKTFFPREFRAITKGKTKEFVDQVTSVALLYANQVQADFNMFSREFGARRSVAQTSPRVQGSRPVRN